MARVVQRSQMSVCKGINVAKTLLVVVPLLLSFTGSNVVRAESAHLEALLEDPEPKARTGPAMRLGTSAGHSVFAGRPVTTVGGYLATTWQVSRLGLEAEYGYFRLRQRVETEDYSGSMDIGRFHRLGLSARLDVIRLGRDWVGENTKLIFWLDVGAGVERGGFFTGERFQREDVTAGWGWLLDHRLKKPLGFPSRVGWHFGWRLVRTDAPKSRELDEMKVACKALSCDEQDVNQDIGLMVSSGIHFSW